MAGQRTLRPGFYFVELRVSVGLWELEAEVVKQRVCDKDNCLYTAPLAGGGTILGKVFANQKMMEKVTSA
eukprot:CAMPEP_0114490586 /NCGR_PEP_ID=MMETSP0109-20121206/2523_1 /TAXON_ID=29199 /ORGANISM="Chlorarachnion reptans, Strain CCCM449" /LENGTH=69 /DNA_ID=CAMNT_0001667217 /DNA_START=426 /DNA_END=635 /DNA_ORIENTATION=+